MFFKVHTKLYIGNVIHFDEFLFTHTHTQAHTLGLILKCEESQQNTVFYFILHLIQNFKLRGVNHFNTGGGNALGTSCLCFISAPHSLSWGVIFCLSFFP